jgi:hypothetical protein
MRIVATARYINLDIHGSNSNPTEAATVPVLVSLGDLQNTVNLPPSPPQFTPPTTVQIEPEITYACPPAVLPPNPIPSQVSPRLVYHGLQALHANLQALRANLPSRPTTPSLFSPRRPLQPERTSNGGMPLSLQTLQASLPSRSTTPPPFSQRPPFEPQRTSNGGMPLSFHFPGLNSRGKGMFPPSYVREERPPVIVPSQGPCPTYVTSGSGSIGRTVF